MPTSKHANITVKRYDRPTSGGYTATVEPADRSWILFLHADGPPDLYVEVGLAETSPGVEERAYMPADEARAIAAAG